MTDANELTTVILDGPMGKQFGKKWKLKVNSPAQALRLIEANKPGIFNFIRNNLRKYPHYRILVDKDERDIESFGLTCKAKTIRFVPLLEGAGGVGRIIAGVAVIIASIYTAGAAGTALAAAQAAAAAGAAGAAGMATTATLLSAAASGLMAMGVSLVLGGVVQLLTKTPSNNDVEERKDRTSHYFDGPVNTEMQGVGIPLIYGRVLVGSHAISAKLVVEQVN